MIRIIIKTGSDAFFGRKREELACILAALSMRFELGEWPTREDDANGNDVCTVTYTGKDRP